MAPRDGTTFWDGVRNYQARNNLRLMKTGDRVLFYHSNVGLEAVGIAKVVKEAYPDPTAKEPGWVVVDLKPVQALERPVSLDEMKRAPALKNILLLRHGRLSVMPIPDPAFAAILKLSKNIPNSATNCAFRQGDFGAKRGTRRDAWQSHVSNE